MSPLLSLSTDIQQLVEVETTVRSEKTNFMEQNRLEPSDVEAWCEPSNILTGV